MLCTHLRTGSSPPRHSPGRVHPRDAASDPAVRFDLCRWRQGMTELIVLCFSGGKDSTLALQALQQKGRYDVAALLTTITNSGRRTRGSRGVARVAPCHGHATRRADAAAPHQGAYRSRPVSRVRRTRRTATRPRSTATKRTPSGGPRQSLGSDGEGDRRQVVRLSHDPTHSESGRAFQS